MKSKTMSGMKIILAVSATMGGLILSAAKPATSNDFTNSVVGPAAGGFELTLGTTNKLFAAGQNITLEAAVKNLSTNTVLINDRDGIIDFSFQVIGPDGKRSALTEYGGGLLYPVRVFHQGSASLEPGQTLSEHIPLSQAFGMTNLGEYNITVSWETATGQHVSAGPLKIQIVNSKN